jgi:DNA-binding CsgD family transcriptional regulator
MTSFAVSHVSGRYKTLNNRKHPEASTRMVVPDSLRLEKPLALLKSASILLLSLSTPADEDITCRSTGRCFHMKPTFRPFSGQDQPNRSSGDRPNDREKRWDSRTRLLLFACGVEDAQLMMLYSERVEIVYLPSHDMQEVREEIERFNPKLILCGAGAFLEALPAPFQGPPSRPMPGANRAIREPNKPRLARRELKILAMLAKGQTNDEIARALRLSSRTVKRVLSNLFERLEVTNRTELVGRAAELSLLQEDS